jgi:hypothetical protein
MKAGDTWKSRSSASACYPTRIVETACGFTVEQMPGVDATPATCEHSKLRCVSRLLADFVAKVDQCLYYVQRSVHGWNPGPNHHSSKNRNSSQRHREESYLQRRLSADAAEAPPRLLQHNRHRAEDLGSATNFDGYLGAGDVTSGPADRQSAPWRFCIRSVARDSPTAFEQRLYLQQGQAAVHRGEPVA